VSKKILVIEMAKTGISAIFNEIFFRLAIEIMLDLPLQKLSKIINKKHLFTFNMSKTKIREIS